MKNFYFNVSATRAYGGVMIRKIYLSPISIVLYAIVLAPYIRLAAVEKYYPPLIIAVFIGWFLVTVLKIFNREVLLNDELLHISGRNLAHEISSDMVDELTKEKKLSSHTLLKAAVHTKRGTFILNEIGITQEQFLSRFEKEINKKIDVYDFLVRAHSLREQFNEKRINANIILYFFFQHGGTFNDLLNERDLSLEDLKKVMQWEKYHYDWEQNSSKWTPEGFVRNFGSIGRSWVLGYTNELDRLTVDISEKAYFKGKNKVIIQQKEIEQAMHVLGRSQQQNLLILGKPGVGKRTMIQNIAYQIRKNEITNSLPLTRVMKLHVEELLSGSGDPDKILLEALKRAQGPGRFVLVLEELSLVLRSNNTNLIAVFSKFLNASNISIIGIADIQDYHTIIKANPGIDMLFDKVQVNDASDDETMSVMMMHYFHLAEKKHLHITFKALKSVMTLSKRYIGRGGFPGKAIAILDDAILSAKRRGDTYVTESDVRQMVSMKANMDISEVKEDEKLKLLNLGEALRKQIIGQDEAIDVLVNTLKRARMDIHSSKKPLGTFLFLGPTGVGKTETAKVLAEQYFGSADSMIRLDMNEYSTESSIAQIIGSPQAGAQHSEGFLARRVQDRPFSLILMDEIEKAHPKVLNIFLQILDEGVLNDSMGMSTDFKNTIIIATSNAGALFIRDFVKEHSQLPKKKFEEELVSTILEQGTFSPEFINRFDNVILYYPLSEKNALRVAIILLDRIINELRVKRGIQLKMEEGVVAAIAKKGYSTEFGAREMRRTVVDIIENYIADYLLRNDVKRGDEIFIKLEDLNI